MHSYWGGDFIHLQHVRKWQRATIIGEMVWLFYTPPPSFCTSDAMQLCPYFPSTWVTDLLHNKITPCVSLCVVKKKKEKQPVQQNRFAGAATSKALSLPQCGCDGDIQNKQRQLYLCCLLSFSRKGSMHLPTNATFQTTGIFLFTTRHYLFPIWDAAVKTMFGSPLFVSMNPRVTFLSWRLLCLRGCERSSTGCRTTERSAPWYTSSSKHCCTHLE